MIYAIEVTEDDIRNGVRGLCACCPVARAIQRCTNYFPVLVGAYEPFDISVVVGLKSVRVVPPPSVKTFVEDFDRGEVVSPFTFQVEIP